jgi:hypothetical protein
MGLFFYLDFPLARDKRIDRIFPRQFALVRVP